MDTVTHLVAGALTPLAFAKAPKTRLMAIYGIVCGQFPDIDVVAGKSAEAILAIHRGITHSVFLQPVFAFLLALVFHRFLKKGDADGSWTFAKTWLVGVSALYIHLFLDCMTTFGTQIFMPFSSYRVALPAMYIIDLLLTVPLLLLWLSLLRKGGSFAPDTVRVGPARKGLLWLFAYPVLALCLNFVATHSLEERYVTAANERGITAVELSPEPFAPFNWKVVGISDDKYHMARFSVADWNGQLSFTEYTRPRADTRAFLRTIPLFAMYDDFASYLYVTGEELDGDRVTSFKDVRYEATMPWLMAALGRTDGLFIFQEKTSVQGTGMEIRFLYRGRDAPNTPWQALPGVLRAG